MVSIVENEKKFYQIEKVMNESLRMERYIECELLRWKIDIIMNENLVIEQGREDSKNKF